MSEREGGNEVDDYRRALTKYTVSYPTFSALPFLWIRTDHSRSQFDGTSFTYHNPRTAAPYPQLLPHVRRPLSTASLPEYIHEHYGAGVCAWSDLASQDQSEAKKNCTLHRNSVYRPRDIGTFFHAAIKLVSSSTMEAPRRVMSCTGFITGAIRKYR